MSFISEKYSFLLFLIYVFSLFTYYFDEGCPAESTSNFSRISVILELGSGFWSRKWLQEDDLAWLTLQFFFVSHLVDSGLGFRLRIWLLENDLARLTVKNFLFRFTVLFWPTLWPRNWHVYIPSGSSACSACLYYYIISLFYFYFFIALGSMDPEG